MHYLTRYIMLLFILTSLSIYSMEMDSLESKKEEISQVAKDSPKSEFPSLFTLCIQKVIPLAHNEKYHHSITTLPEEIQSTLKSHLQKIFDPSITRTILEHYKNQKIKRSKLVFNSENTPPLQECSPKDISCSWSTGKNGGFLYDTSDFISINNKLISRFALFVITYKKILEKNSFI